MSERKWCIRKSDGTVWEPSCPDGYDEAQAIADTMFGPMRWYFRGGWFARCGWWPFRRWAWLRDGEIWQPESGEFEVVTREVAIQRSAA